MPPTTPCVASCAILTVTKVHPHLHAILISWSRIPVCSSGMRHDVVLCPFHFCCPSFQLHFFIISQLYETLMIITYTMEFPSFACTLSS